MASERGKSVVLALALWNIVFCTSGTVYGFSTLGIPSDVFFISGNVMMCLAAAVVGPILDTCGASITGALGSLIAALGYLTLAAHFAMADSSVTSAYLGLALVTFGGQGPY
eukprot:TRINITY_DN31214_c0_g1_i2.p1 TRINITY_DN31214_c0_g1~~TRINITY_DN31214_c0_g1_i2.p1  ORF type:complete len:111 (-),score=7.87 TRINITY_DN31214_c0_g1_i2:101-433(-)